MASREPDDCRMHDIRDVGEACKDRVDELGDAEEAERHHGPGEDDADVATKAKIIAVAAS